MKEPVPLDQLVQAWTDRTTVSPAVRPRRAPSYGPMFPEPQETIQIRNPRDGKPVRVPFAIKTIADAGGGNYEVTIWPGWIREIITQGGGTPPPDGSIFHMPEVSAVRLDADDPPVFTMIDGDYLAVKYQTDDHGTIKVADPDKPTVVASATQPETIHYQPPPPDGGDGVDGDYRITIGRLQIIDGAPVWQTWQNSDIEHYHDILNGENLGAGAKVFKKWSPEENRYQYRTVYGRFGLAHESGEEQIELDADIENVGGANAVWKEYTGFGDDPPPTPPDESIKLRTIRGLSSDEGTAESITPQIQVSIEDGESSDPGAADTIRIRGNGIKGALIFKDCADTEIARIEWEDGLVVTSGDVEVTVTTCDTELPP